MRAIIHEHGGAAGAGRAESPSMGTDPIDREEPRPRRLAHHFSMIRSFHAADVLTLGNGASGMGAIFCSLSYVERPQTVLVLAAGIFVVLALLFDVLDGRVARWRHRASPLGRELDSLADIVSFGVAPACLAYAIGMSGVLDQLVLAYFVCCGISRLARYNVTADELAAETGKVTYFEGTPIPTSIVLVALLVLLALVGRTGARLPLGVYSIAHAHFHPLVLLFFASGSLMISKTLRIPKP
jgi:CDP-diacylglycerol--serine O-phosphatidyltransferase